MTTHAEAIQAAAIECIGTPYVYQGRVVGHGLDCGGLIDHCRRAVGWPAAPVPRYSFPPSSKVLLREFAKYLRPLDLEARPGVVMAFWIGRPGRVRHTGVCVEMRGRLWVVEAHNLRHRVTRESLLPEHLDRLHSCWEIPPHDDSEPIAAP